MSGAFSWLGILLANTHETIFVIVYSYYMTTDSLDPEKNPDTWTDHRSSVSIVSQALGITGWFQPVNAVCLLSEEDKKAFFELVQEYHDARHPGNRRHPFYNF